VPDVTPGAVTLMAVAFAAYGVGAGCATMRASALARLAAAAVGTVVLATGARKLLGTGWGGLAGPSPTWSAAFAVSGVALVALAGGRLRGALDDGRRASALESVAVAAAATALVLVLSGVLGRWAATAVMAARTWEATGGLPRVDLHPFAEGDLAWASIQTAQEAGALPARWTEVRVASDVRSIRVLQEDEDGMLQPIEPLRWLHLAFARERSAWKGIHVWRTVERRQAFLDREHGVVRALDLLRVRVRAGPSELPRDAEVVLRPAHGRFAPDAAVEGSEIREPQSGRAWTLQERRQWAPDGRRFELVQTAGDAAVPAPDASPRPPPPLRWNVGTRERGWTLSVAAPGGEPELVRWTLVDGIEGIPWVFTGSALLRGPGVGLVSFASDRNPRDRASVVLEAAHYGGRRAGLLLAEAGVALLGALLAVRVLRRRGASRARTLAWAGAVLAVGPLGIPVLLALEPAPRPARPRALGWSWRSAHA
jgi:hypothetical protein